MQAISDAVVVIGQCMTAAVAAAAAASLIHSHVHTT